jgi:PleD family two-component response regulator
VAETVAGRATPTAPIEGAVLLVDADPNVAELLTMTLVVQGFQVYTAADGPAAVERARAVRPDAVILEVTLPGVEDTKVASTTTTWWSVSPACEPGSSGGGGLAVRHFLVCGVQRPLDG